MNATQDEQFFYEILSMFNHFTYIQLSYLVIRIALKWLTRVVPASVCKCKLKRFGISIRHDNFGPVTAIARVCNSGYTHMCSSILWAINSNRKTHKLFYGYVSVWTLTVLRLHTQQINYHACYTSLSKS